MSLKVIEAEKAALLGALTWFYVSQDTLIEVEKLEQSLFYLDLEDFIPSRRAPSDAVRKSITKAMSAFKRFQFRRHQSSLLVNPVPHMDNNTWQVDIQQHDGAGKKIGYIPNVARILLRGESCQWGWVGEAIPEIQDALDDIPNSVQGYRDFHDADKIRVLIRKLLRVICAFPVRDGVQFVVEQHFGFLDTLCEIFESPYSGEIRFSRYDLGASPKNRENLSKDVQLSIQDTLTRIQGVLVHSKGAETDVPSGRLVELLEDIDAVRAGCKTLGVVLDNLELPESVEKAEERIKMILSVREKKAKKVVKK